MVSQCLSCVFNMLSTRRKQKEQAPLQEGSHIPHLALKHCVVAFEYETYRNTQVLNKVREIMNVLTWFTGPLQPPHHPGRSRNHGGRPDDLLQLSTSLSREAVENKIVTGGAGQMAEVPHLAPCPGTRLLIFPDKKPRLLYGYCYLP